MGHICSYAYKRRTIVIILGFTITFLINLIITCCVYSRRESLVEEVIERNVELPVCNINEIILSDKETFVIEKLNVKEVIIYNAKAILAVTQKKYVIDHCKRV